VRDTCTTEAIDKIVRQVRAAMAGPAACDGRVVEPIATMGAAAVAAGDSAQTVRRNADLALYHAKETNRGGFVWHSPRLHPHPSGTA